MTAVSGKTVPSGGALATRQFDAGDLEAKMKAVEEAMAPLIVQASLCARA